MLSRIKGAKAILYSALSLVVVFTMTVSALVPVSIIAKADKNLAVVNSSDHPSNVPEGTYYKYPFQNPNLAVDERVSDLISRLTLDEKIGLLHQFSAAIIRLGVPQFRTGTEGLHGLSWLGYATVFPQNTGMAMTWDKDLIEQAGEVVGEEARAYNSVDARFQGIDIWAPVIDLARDPRSGRASESMGEDPYLTGMMSTNYAFGMKGTDSDFYYEAIPTLKHFAAYGQEASRTAYSANASPRNLYEYYFKDFMYGIESGAATGVMTAYNLINGKPSMTFPEMMDKLFGDWVPGGYDSSSFFNVTDASSPGNLTGSNAYYPNSQIGKAAAFADSIKSGITAFTVSDTNTPPSRQAIYEALARGMLTEEDIDKDIRGVLTVRCHAGDLDADPINPYKSLNKQNALTTDENTEVAAQMAREQVVLLKNANNTLPLNKNLASVALVGPLGDESSTDFYAGTFPYTTYIKDTVQDKLTHSNALAFSRGIDTVALQVTGGTAGVDGTYVTVGATPDAPITGGGSSASDPKAQFFLYDYGYNNLLLRSVQTGRYLTASGSGNTILANSNPPGYESPNRASQEWSTNQNFGWAAGTSGSTVTLKFSKGTGVVSPTGARGVYVNTSSPYNVLSNGNASSSNSAFNLITVVDGIDDAVAKAQSANVAIVAVGDEPHLTSRETNDRSTTGDNIELAQGQEDLINAVAAVNSNTIVVIVGSYPFAISSINNNANVKAILYTSHAGPELGNAVADVLFGDYAPSGRLNQTWYTDLSTLPPITDYDIIKGHRTYQYYTGTPLFPFGYGLTYTSFTYSNMQVSPTSTANTSTDGINVSVKVKNTGTVASDEVVELYTKYATPGSKITHPLKTLSGFERVHLYPNEEKTVTMTVNMSQLAIWDVSQSRYYVEPGTYTFMIGRSSADADIQLSKDVTVTGDPIGPRDLGVITPALNFDDYSFTTSADVIPTSAMEDDTYSITATNVAGSWVEYKDVDVNPAPAGIALRASNSNTTPQTIQVWMNGRTVEGGGTQLGTVTIPATGHIQTFINVGGNLTGFDADPDGRADIYLVFPTSNISVKWLQLGNVVQANGGDIVITSNHYNTNASTSLSRLHVKVDPVITQKSGALLMEAMLNGSDVVASPVTWTVTDTSDAPTTLATISTSGQLTAAGTGDGTVKVVATYTLGDTMTISNSMNVTLQNQTVAANTNPEAVIIRSGNDSHPADISWGPNQFSNFGSIYKYKGTLLLSAVTYPTISPARPVTFTLGDVDGNPTNLATIVEGSQAAGFIEGQTSGATYTGYNVTVQATGVGDGDVYLTATTTNGLTYTSKIIIQGQAVHEAFDGRFEAELFDKSGNVTDGVTANLRADDTHGDDMGLQLNRIRNGDYAVYNNIDFGTNQVSSMAIKYLKVSSVPATIHVFVDFPTVAAGGKEIGSITLAGEKDITSSYADVVYNWQETNIPLTTVSGVHDMFLVFDVDNTQVPDTDISSTYGAVPGWLDLGINWFTFQQGAQPTTASPANQEVQYSDQISPVTLTMTDPDSASLTLVSADLPDGLELSEQPTCAPADAGVQCSWTLSGQMLASAGTKDLSLVVNDGIGDMTVTFSSVITVVPETVTINVNSQSPVTIQASSQDTSTGSANLQVSVAEYDPTSSSSAMAGDINKAVLSLSLTPVAGGDSINGTCAPTAAAASGYSTLTFACSFTAVPAGEYDYHAVVNGGFYQGSLNNSFTQDWINFLPLINR